jgi:hypothetical protein
MCFDRGGGVKAGWELRAQMNAVILTGEDQTEAVKTFIGKRQVQFKGK